MTTYLQKAIADRREKIADLAAKKAQIDQETAITEAELRAYEDALAHIPVATASTTKETTPRTKRGGRRGLSQHWKAVLKAMAKAHPQTSGYDDIDEVLTQYGKAIRRGNMRRHILSYIETGYIERIRDGQFRATEKGAKIAGVRLVPASSVPSQDETPDVSASGVSSNVNGGGSPLMTERSEPRLLT